MWPRSRPSQVGTKRSPWKPGSNLSAPRRERGFCPACIYCCLISFFFFFWKSRSQVLPHFCFLFFFLGGRAAELPPSSLPVCVRPKTKRPWQGEMGGLPARTSISEATSVFLPLTATRSSVISGNAPLGWVSANFSGVKHLRVSNSPTSGLELRGHFVERRAREYSKVEFSPR